jgi:signal transduction histidine kinase
LASEFTPRDNPDEFLSFTQKIRSETKRLNEIIARFLALAREEKRDQTRIDLDELITEVVGLLRVEADRLSIELETDVASGATIRADPDKLKQVFLNLFNNTKEAFGGDPGRVKVSSEATDDGAVVRFTDNGPGIERDVQERVFNPYFTTRESGTGLGLSVVHKIVSDLGGEIVVGDSEWGGAEFVITIPFDRHGQ